MKQPFILTLVSSVACAATAANKAPENTTPTKSKTPNVVFIYADDLGYGDLECYGAKNVQTPNVNRLAKSGILFTNAHATAATSTPSRFGLLTGMYPWRQKNTGIAPGNSELIIDTILRALRDEPGFWWHTYKRAWKQNFRSSLVPGIVFTVLWALLAWSAFVLPQMTEISLSFALILLLDAVLLLTLGNYFWMQNALFYGSIFQKSSNCIRMFFGFLPQTALSAIVQVGYWLLIAFLIPRCAFMFLLTGL